MENQQNRGIIILIVVGVVFVGFIARLLSIQVLSKAYSKQGERNIIATRYPTPPRGNIFDRKSRIFVSNRPLFTMMITPRDLVIPDTSILEHYLQMSREEIREGIAQAEDYSSVKASVLARYIEPEQYAQLLEQLWDFRGIHFENTNKRYYNHALGGHILGYIGEVNPKDIEKSKPKDQEVDDLWYFRGDQIGKSGIELHYEEWLRGDKGIKKVLKDPFNREVGSYAEGAFDEEALRGKDLLLGIDVDLQAFGESLMQNKKGSIVALDPKSGEILAFVSAPAYNPNILTGRELRQNWRELSRDTLNPLYNRALSARYPPGSIFKLPLALAALNEGVLSPDTRYRCGGGWWRLGGKPGCHAHGSPLDLHNAIRHSCNAYFAETYFGFLHSDKFEGGLYEGYETWYEYMKEFGLGRELGIDIPFEVSGLIPATQKYDEWYGKDKWVATTIISNSIGQGEILMTPLQMANMAAMIANEGYYYPPHFVRAIRDSKNEDWRKLPVDRVTTRVAPRHFGVVKDGMQSVVQSGTARRAQIEGIEVCGKTGTVENPHGEDHSVFIGFAPKDNPRIAVAVVVENSGFGGTWAAPTAALMMEQYLTGKIEHKKWEYQRVLNADFIK